MLPVFCILTPEGCHCALPMNKQGSYRPSRLPVAPGSLLQILPTPGVPLFPGPLSPNGGRQLRLTPNERHGKHRLHCQQSDADNALTLTGHLTPCLTQKIPALTLNSARVPLSIQQRLEENRGRHA
ncbi:MAG: hypothetical protein OXC07_10845 [Kistimonas sp.]|nr:hypothetical protein [Kistimonas sp.]